MKSLIFFVGLIILPRLLSAQVLEAQIEKIQSELDQLDLRKVELLSQLESNKLDKVVADMKKVGFPSDDYIQHTAMVLSYNEEHEQANWVMHMIMPEIKDGVVFRSNDFRVDPLVSTGTANQEDYFLTDTLASGEVNYDGFGYDRGHLAPSADYRWSATALSETYFYSNMSPQLAEFNRESWAKLEDHLRKYVIDHGTPLYVITAPVLKAGLPTIERAINSVSIPTEFVKIALDLENKRAIAFIMPNKKLDYPLEHYAVSIDEAERKLKMDVFPLFDQNEASFDLGAWFESIDNGDREPLGQDKVGRGRFNTVVGGKRIGKKSVICGHVVSSRISRSGHLWLNIDKQFPNQIFSIFIRKEDLVNFPYKPDIQLVNQDFCFEGKVEDLNGTPTINIKRANQVEAYSN